MSLSIITGLLGAEDLSQSAAGGTLSRTRNVAGTETTGTASKINASNLPILAAATAAVLAGLDMTPASSYAGPAIEKIAKGIPGPVFNVRAYGAVGDGVTNDAAAIQAAIAAAEAAGTCACVYFPRGTYLINTGLTAATPGKEVLLMGAGRRAATIKAGAAITMLTFSANDGQFHGRKRIQGLSFDGGDLATSIVDGTYLRYSTFADCNFEGMAADAPAITIGNWVNRVENCRFNGLAADGTTAVGNGLLIPSGSVINNMVVARNEFTSCKVGITCSTAPNDLVIEDNCFDVCTGAAIWLKSGGRKITIERNYFEACGSTGVSVQEALSTFVTWYGAIVAHTVYSSLSTTHKNLSIRNNHFANCSSNSYITLSSIVALDVSGNMTHESYTGSAFVTLDWVGIYYTVGRRCIIDHQPAASQFTTLVALSTDENRSYTAGLIIRDGSDLPQSLVANGGNLFGLPLNWPSGAGTLSMGRDGTFEGEPIWRCEGTSATKRIDVTIEGTRSYLKGRYVRMGYITKGVGGGDNGLWLRVYIDTGSGLTETYSGMSFTGTNWVSNRSPVLYIPTNAITVRFEIRPVTNASPCLFTRFNICLASLENDGVTRVDENLKLPSVPAYGTWSKGDIVLNSLPDPGEAVGWVCTTAGTSGTWNAYGRIEMEGSTTWDPPNLASGASQTTTVTVPGAAVGDYVQASFSITLNGTTLHGYVSAADTVTVVHSNLTGAARDLGSGTLRARVSKQ